MKTRDAQILSWTLRIVGCLAMGSAPAMALELKGLDLSTGKPFALDTQKSSTKATVIVFMSSTCPCSKSHEKTLAKLAADFGGVANFVGVHSNANEAAAQAAEHFKKADLKFPVIQDDKLALADRLKAFKTPHVFVLNAQSDNPIYQGGVTDSHVATTAKKNLLGDALKQLQQGALPSPQQTRSLGCVISRSAS